MPLQIQMLESEMLPYWDNRIAPNGNYIMNGVEFDFIGRRVAYWFFTQHPGDGPIEVGGFTMDQVRVPASEILHVFRVTRPGQVRGVPLVTPALVKLYFLDQYDDAELDRKKIAAMYAGFITSPAPEDILPDVSSDANSVQVGIAPLERGTMQALLPGEDIKFSDPADVGGSYEAFQYRQQLGVFSAMGVPYMLATGDTRRASYSSLRGVIVEYRRRLEQLQHNVMVFQLCRPIWQRWMSDAVLAGTINLPGYVDQVAGYQRAKWIAPRFEWVDPLKDRQAEKLAVDSGFKSRSDVVEAEGYDPRRPTSGSRWTTSARSDSVSISRSMAPRRRSRSIRTRPIRKRSRTLWPTINPKTPQTQHRSTTMRRWFSMKLTAKKTGEIMIYDEIGRSFWGEDTLSAKDFDAELKALGDIEQLNLRINSPGGDVFDGVAIHNTIKSHPANVTPMSTGSRPRRPPISRWPPTRSSCRRTRSCWCMAPAALRLATRPTCGPWRTISIGSTSRSPRPMPRAAGNRPTRSRR